MDIAEGEFVTFVDSDDWLALDAIEALMDEMSKKGLDLVEGQSHSVTFYIKPIKKYYINYFADKSDMDAF